MNYFFYFSNWVGTGTRQDPFRPRIWDPIIQAGGRPQVMDLRNVNQRTTANGWALCISDVQAASTPTGTQLLFTAPAELDTAVSTQVRNTLNSNLGTNFAQGTTWRQVLIGLQTVEGQGKWGSFDGGNLAMLLGPLGVLDL
jgi:hypothetical protein